MKSILYLISWNPSCILYHEIHPVRLQISELMVLAYKRIILSLNIPESRKYKSVKETKRKCYSEDSVHKMVKLLNPLLIFILFVLSNYLTKFKSFYHLIFSFSLFIFFSKSYNFYFLIQNLYWKKSHVCTRKVYYSLYRVN